MMTFWLFIGNVGRRLSELSSRKLEKYNKPRHIVDIVKESIGTYRPRVIKYKEDYD